MHDITDTLPQIIRNHVAAYNAHDPEALLATLAPDALVNDIRREFHGHAAIRAWADKEIFGPKITLAVERAYDQHGDVVLHVRVDGNFDRTNLPDPLILSYYFSLRAGLITQLIILRNTATA
jgi:hypothetical protein